MKIKVLAAAICAAGAAVGLSAPASATVTVYTSEAAFDAAISGMAVYTPTNVASGNTYQLGPVTVTTGNFFVSYTGDYGPGIPELGAFGSPVTFSSPTNALALNVGYYIGPVQTTYTIDGVTGTVTVPDNNANPNTLFIGFTDDKPITVAFGTNSAEFDTLRAITGTVPEPATWALMIGGVAMTGAALRRRRKVATAFA